MADLDGSAVGEDPISLPRHWDSPASGAAASQAEAALLLRRMTTSERQRLRTLALCLARAQRSGELPALPIHIVGRLLAEAAAVHASLILPEP